MTQDEVLNALNTEGELPWFAYIDGSPVLIAPPEEAVVTRELGGVLYVQEGDEAVLSVSAVSPDNASLSYKWQKDGEDITGIEAASYTIPAVTLSDGGDYSVRVVNQNQREETAGEVDGSRCSSEWFMIDEKWYYLNPVSDGRRSAMYADAWIDGYYLGKDGAWVE